MVATLREMAVVPIDLLEYARGLLKTGGEFLLVELLVLGCGGIPVSVSRST